MEPKKRINSLFQQSEQTVRLIQIDLGEIEKQIYAYYQMQPAPMEREPLTDEDKASFESFMKKVLV